MRLALILAALVLAPAARAARIDVTPGPGAIQTAVNAASPGDTLVVHAGTYAEAVTIDRSLRLIGVGASQVTIDAGCGAFSALAVTADGVTIQGVSVTGATELTIDVEQRDRVTVRNTRTVQSCGTEEYGINLYHSTHIRLVGNVATGFADAGVYIGGIDASANVRALRNTCTGNNRGLIVEDSFPSVVVRGNVLTGNATDGIFLHNSDGVVVAHNTSTGSGNYGIHADSTSDDNLLARNTISGSAVFDVFDEGSSNCWRNDSFVTGTPNPNGC